ncbi:hypothetical protein [Pasteurella canis]|uniref:hypothetical protein n=1 Tax=Pasteurella canis TaxID=753 RepID=UPI00132500F6|nr:hypothetical protein [Pasteurella canis]MXN88474.1 hypothetical protein [Pasteurella canis]
MSKSVGKFINLSEEWELNYCLEKYDYPTTKKNREKLINLIKNSIKPYFKLSSSDNLSWVQLDEYYNLSPIGLKAKGLKANK